MWRVEFGPALLAPKRNSGKRQQHTDCLRLGTVVGFRQGIGNSAGLFGDPWPTQVEGSRLLSRNATSYAYFSTNAHHWNKIFATVVWFGKDSPEIYQEFSRFWVPDSLPAVRPRRHLLRPPHYREDAKIVGSAVEETPARAILRVRADSRTRT